MWRLQSYSEGEKLIMGGGRRERSVREREGRKEKKGSIRGGRKHERSTECQEFEWRFVAIGDGELGVATRKFQIPGIQKYPRTQQR